MKPLLFMFLTYVPLLVLSLSALVLSIKSMQYENNALVFDNQVQYNYFFTMLWFTLIFGMLLVLPFFAQLAMTGGKAMRYFFNTYIFSVLIFSASCIYTLYGSVTDDLIVYLPNQYVVFALFISWFLLLCVQTVPVIYHISYSITHSDF
jgi:hypothetical protein